MKNFVALIVCLLALQYAFAQDTPPATPSQTTPETTTPAQNTPPPATAIQTVGIKGYDGFAIALVN